MKMYSVSGLMMMATVVAVMAMSMVMNRSWSGSAAAGALVAALIFYLYTDMALGEPSSDCVVAAVADREGCHPPTSLTRSSPRNCRQCHEFNREASPRQYIIGIKPYCTVVVVEQLKN